MYKYLIIIILLSSCNNLKITSTKEDNSPKKSNGTEIKNTISKDKKEILEFVDYTDLNKWRVYNKKDASPWKMKDNCLYIKGYGAADLITKTKHSNFILELEWKTVKKTNSGIMLRVQERKDKASWYSGIEMQVLSKTKGTKMKNNIAGAIYALVNVSPTLSKEDGEFNKVKIIVKDSVYTFYFNGKKVARFDVSSKEFDEKIAKSKFKSFVNFGKFKTGHICLQQHGGEVWYRNIRIKDLK